MTPDCLAELDRRMPFWCARSEQALDRYLPAPVVHPARLHEAMRYSVLGGGKRVRPVLTYAPGLALDVPESALDAPAAAEDVVVHRGEIVVHQRLGVDELDSRGKATCHRQFDEATAILAGDALQALAFHVLAHDAAMTADATTRIAMIETLACAAGSRGMAGGQAIDLAAVGRDINIAELEDMHIHKTGALIRAAVRLAALSTPGLDDHSLRRLDHYAKCVGLAFQIRDDILDVEANTEVLGKRQGADIALNKHTNPALLGLGEASARAQMLHEDALASLADFDERADALRGISHYIIARGHCARGGRSLFVLW